MRLALSLAGCLVGSSVIHNSAFGQSPDAANELMAALRTTVRCQTTAVSVEDRPAAAAIVFGYHGDTVLAVTANHVVRRVDTGCEVIDVRLDLHGPGNTADAFVLSDFDEVLDVAVIAAVYSNRKTLRSIRRIRGVSAPTDNLFLIGCPSTGECWERPLEVRVRERFPFFRDTALIVVQSPLIEDGFSGGPAVTSGGEVVGMTLDYGGQNAHVRSWSTIENWLRTKGYTSNLPVRRVDALGRNLLLFELGVEPFGVRNADDSRLLPSASIRYEEWGDAGGSFWLSLERLSLPIERTCSDCGDGRQLLGTAGHYLGFGIALAPRDRGYSVLGRTFGPLSPSIAIGVLAGSSEQLVRRELPDSTDPRDGLPPTVYIATKRSATAVLEVSGSLTLGLHRRVGVRITPRLLRILSMDSGFGRISASQFSLGAGLTVPLR